MPAPEGREVADRLLGWYDRHGRRLPWRAPPGARPEPYRVWLSEVMLQQTTTAAAAPYFERFLARWPDVHALAAAPQEEVLAAWAGLGYYARARNLHACARVVSRDLGGRFPADEMSLRRLPGIGPYTAAAVAAIAFDRPAVPVDGNVERVMARLHAVDEALPAAKPRLAALARELPAAGRPGDLAQALMDLGATVCLPRRPRCAVCPLSDACRARARGVAEDLPVKAPKRARPTRRAVAFWTTRPDGTVLLRRRPERGMLGGMLEVPSTEWTREPWGEAAALARAPLPAAWEALPGRVRHGFTHFDFEVTVWAGEAAAAAEAPDGARWTRLDRLGEAGLPTVMRKIAEHALARAGERVP